MIRRVQHEVRYRAESIANRFSEWRRYSRKRRILNDWYRELRADPPDVLLGANLNRREGIRNHLIGIRDHSALKISLAPPDPIVEALSYHDLHSTLASVVQSFDPRGIGTIHSHVYPYYIEWCRRWKGAGPLWIHTYHLPYFRLDESTPLLDWQVEINRALTEVARHAHVRLSVAKWQQQFLEEHHGIETTYLPNGVDVTVCDRGDASAFDVAPQDDFVLYVGRDDPIKNPREFVQLAGRMPEIRFVMIGMGLTADVAASFNGGTCPTNLLVLGEARRDQVQNALASAALVVVTSLREGLPTLVLEAMAHGRSIVVSDEAGSAEAVDGGRYGFIYRLGDIDDLVEKARAALEDDTRRRGARDRVLSEYDWRAVAPRLDAIYRGETIT